MDIIITVQVRDAGKPIGPPITEQITFASYLAGLVAEQQGHVLDSMIKCALLREAAFQAATAAVWNGATS
jgi:hypothetical protein